MIAWLNCPTILNIQYTIFIEGMSLRSVMHVTPVYENLGTEIPLQIQIGITNKSYEDKLLNKAHKKTKIALES